MSVVSATKQLLARKHAYPILLLYLREKSCDILIRNQIQYKLSIKKKKSNTSLFSILMGATQNYSLETLFLQVLYFLNQSLINPAQLSCHSGTVRLQQFFNLTILCQNQPSMIRFLCQSCNFGGDCLRTSPEWSSYCTRCLQRDVVVL
jgi:hypothetical protein